MGAGAYWASVYSDDDDQDVTATLVETCCAATGLAGELTYDSHSGKFELRYAESGYSFTTQAMKEGSEDLPILDIAMDLNVFGAGVYTTSQHVRQMDMLLVLLSELSAALSAEYVPVFNTERRGTEVRPNDTPIAEHIGALPLMGVYSESTIETLGGIDAMFDEPPQCVVHLTSGHRIILESNSLWGRSEWEPPRDLRAIERVEDGPENDPDGTGEPSAGGSG